MSNSKRKKLIKLTVVIVLVLAVFLGYPLIICCINFPAIEKEKNRVIDIIESFGGEIFSSKVILSTEIDYDRGNRILYGTEYVIIYKSDKTIDEIYEELPWQLSCPLDEVGLWGFGKEQIKSVRQPDQKDGYYLTYFPYKTTISESGGTIIHSFIYGDKDQ